MKTYTKNIQCKITILKSPKELNLYSFKHLKLILEKVNDEYKNPFYYSSRLKKNIFLNETNMSELEFPFEKSIEIKEKDISDNKKKIEEIFKNIMIFI